MRPNIPHGILLMLSARLAVQIWISASLAAYGIAFVLSPRKPLSLAFRPSP